MTVHLIHGIHSQGPSTLTGFAPLLLDYVYPDYGYIYGAETRFVNPALVGAIGAYIKPDDILICHSNGCAIAYGILLRGVRVAGAVFINAALEQNIVRPPTCPWIDVYFNEGDQITEAAAIAAKIGLSDPVWGMMGHAGYNGADPNICNIDCGATPGLPVLSGHSDFAVPTHFASWGPWLLARRKIT